MTTPYIWSAVGRIEASPRRGETVAVDCYRGEECNIGRILLRNSS